MKKVFTILVVAVSLFSCSTNEEDLCSKIIAMHKTQNGGDYADMHYFIRVEGNQEFEVSQSDYVNKYKVGQTYCQ